MNLSELKQSLLDEEDMTEIYSKIRGWAVQGSKEVYIKQDEITELQVDKLRENGYKVEWNRSCLWYEISGW